MKINKMIADQIEGKHNVYIDMPTEKYNVGGGYNAETGWMPIPLSWKIEGLRYALGLSRAELGQAIGISPRTIEAWEQGWRSPSKPALILMQRLIEEGH